MLAISDNNTIQRSQSYAFWSAQTHGAAAEDWICDREKVRWPRRKLEDILKTLIITSGDFKCEVFVIFLSLLAQTICPVNFRTVCISKPELLAKVGILGEVLTNGCRRLNSVHIECGHIILLSPCLGLGQEPAFCRKQPQSVGASVLFAYGVSFRTYEGF